MIFPLRTPRVNNNDDTVKLSAIFATVGAFVREGEMVAEVETDKATFTVEASRAGYFLKSMHTVGEKIAVGSVLAWMGEDATDVAPEEKTETALQSRKQSEPTLKAALLLNEFGIKAGDVPSTSDRLSVAEVQAYISANSLKRVQESDVAPQGTAPAADTQGVAISSYKAETLTGIERGMLRTVSWHGTVAVPGYVEIACDAKMWDDYGAAFQKEHALLLNPMLSLMAYRLVGLAAKNAKFNGTVRDDQKILYESVNVGFTVQSGDNLYLIVVSDAEKMSAREFVARMLELQKAAMKNKLSAAETSGATIAFTSMARWGVVRHQPILAPHTSLMVAHSATVTGQFALGATYDHRLLSGADAVAALHYLKEPPESI